VQLRLSYEEWTRLRITTIGSFDLNKRERAKLRKQRKPIRDRERQARKHAQRGALPRAQYLARSLARTQPWKPQYLPVHLQLAASDLIEENIDIIGVRKNAIAPFW